MVRVLYRILSHWMDFILGNEIFFQFESGRQSLCVMSSSGTFTSAQGKLGSKLMISTLKSVISPAFSEQKNLYSQLKINIIMYSQLKINIIIHVRIYYL